MNLDAEMEKLKGCYYINLNTKQIGILVSWSWSSRSDIFEVKFKSVSPKDYSFFIMPFSGYYIGNLQTPLDLKVAMSGYAQVTNTKLFKLVFL